MANLWTKRRPGPAWCTRPKRRTRRTRRGRHTSSRAATAQFFGLLCSSSQQYGSVRPGQRSNIYQRSNQLWRELQSHNWLLHGAIQRSLSIFHYCLGHWRQSSGRERDEERKIRANYLVRVASVVYIKPNSCIKTERAWQGSFKNSVASLTSARLYVLKFWRIVTLRGNKFKLECSENHIQKWN